MTQPTPNPCEHELKLTGYTTSDDHQRALTASLACTLCDHTRTVLTGKTPAQLDALLREQEMTS